MNTVQPVILKPEDYVTTTKMMKVALNSKTQYIGISMEDLKAGDKIVVSADSFPSRVDSLTALKIAKSAVPSNVAPQ